MPGTVPPFLKATVLLPTLLVWYSVKDLYPTSLNYELPHVCSLSAHLLVTVTTPE